NKISHDAGATFQMIDFGEFQSDNPEILGMCKAQPDTIYAIGGNNILRSDDRGQTWRKYADTGMGLRFRRLDSLYTFAVDPQDPDKVYTMNSQYDLAVFDGTTVTGLGVLALAGGIEMRNFVRSVALDPNHPEIIYAGMFSAGFPCAFRSTDGGDTWEDITNNLPHCGLGAMAVNPHSGELMRGSAFGTWIYPAPYPSDNYLYNKAVPMPVGVDHEPTTDPQDPQDPQDPHDPQDPEPDHDPEPEPEPEAIIRETRIGCSRNIINPFKGETSKLEIDLTEPQYISIVIYDSTGRVIKTIVSENRNNGRHTFYWGGETSHGEVVGSGVYMVGIKAGDHTETKKIVVIK
ncbi:MAG: T9SS type A sorting domain-containing protein, partial [Elusimicrobia bacterium]|nr:T9SS type A sorting domain-containing protein [Elusimicrobiota bacterium]